MPFGSSKVILACPCLRSLIKASERQKARILAYTAHSSNTGPSPAHCHLPGLGLGLDQPLKQEESIAQHRGACTCCQCVGPSSHLRWPRAQWLLSRGQSLGAHSHAVLVHPSIPPNLGTTSRKVKVTHRILPEWHAETTDVHPNLCSNPEVWISFRDQKGMLIHVFLRREIP